MLLALQVIPLVSAAISPSLYTCTVLHIVLPLAQVASPVSMLIESITVSLIILPIAFINVAVCVPKLALAICPVVLPLALVFASIGPDLSAPAHLDFFFRHVTVIHCSVFRAHHFVYHCQPLLLDQSLQSAHLVFSL